MAGLSIVELMVGVALGFLLISVTVSTWVTNKKSYTLQEDLGRIQENARFALSFLEYDIRMAGYFGCKDDGPVAAVESDGSNLTIRYYTSANFEVSGIVKEASKATITLTDAADAVINDGDTLGISSCTNTELVTVAENGLTREDGKIKTIETASPMSDKGYESSSVYLYRSYTYSLNGTDLQRGGQSLVSGVEAWELLFGEDTNGSGSTNLEPDIYRDAASVSDWSKVRTVRIALLISSTNTYGPDKDTRTYDLLNVDNDVDVADFDDPDDERRRRRVFRTTVITRNL